MHCVADDNPVESIITRVRVVDLKTYKRLSTASQAQRGNFDVFFHRFKYDSKTRTPREADVKLAPRFCSCGEPENPDRLMVACEGCATWFHADCVGFHVTRKKGGGSSSGGEFRCALCKTKKKRRRGSDKRGGGEASSRPRRKRTKNSANSGDAAARYQGPRKPTYRCNGRPPPLPTTATATAATTEEGSDGDRRVDSNRLRLEMHRARLDQYACLPAHLPLNLHLPEISSQRGV